MSTPAQWDSMSQWYYDFPQKSTMLFSHSFLPYLSFRNPKSICQVACGGGRNIELLSNTFPQASIKASDFSSNMVQKARLHSSDKISVIEADNQALPYQNLEFDTYISILSLMLVKNPDQMLDQAYRVLQRGGVAFFAVWDSLQACTFCNTIYTHFQVPFPESPQVGPTKFASEEKLNNKLIEHGFSRVVTYKLPIPMPITTVEEGVEYLKEDPQIAQLLNQPEKYEAALVNLRAVLQTKLGQTNSPLIFAGICAIAYKDQIIILDFTLRRKIEILKEFALKSLKFYGGQQKWGVQRVVLRQTKKKQSFIWKKPSISM